MVKHLSAMLETQVQSLGQEDPLEKEIATHSSTLAWKIPWTRNLVGYSPWGRKESDTTERLTYESRVNEYHDATFQVLNVMLAHSKVTTGKVLKGEQAR